MKLRVSFILFFRVIFTEKSISDIVLKSQGHLQGKKKVREGHGTMVRACGFEYCLVQDFQRNIMFIPSQSWNIVSMVCPWARHFNLKCFT